MEQITFLDNKSERYWALILIVAFLSIVLNFFDLLSAFPENIGRTAEITAYIFMMVYFIRMWAPRNMVHWNKKGLTMRIGRFNRGLTFSFADITSYSLSNFELLITSRTHGTGKLNLENIASEDRSRLERILDQYINIGKLVALWEQ